METKADRQIVSSIKDAKNVWGFLEVCFLDLMHAFLHCLSKSAAIDVRESRFFSFN